MCGKQLQHNVTSLIDAILSGFVTELCISAIDCNPLFSLLGKQLSALFVIRNTKFSEIRHLTYQVPHCSLKVLDSSFTLIEQSLYQ